MFRHADFRTPSAPSAPRQYAPVLDPGGRHVLASGEAGLMCWALSSGDLVAQFAVVTESARFSGH